MTGLSISKLVLIVSQKVSATDKANICRYLIATHFNGNLDISTTRKPYGQFSLRGLLSLDCTAVGEDEY